MNAKAAWKHTMPLVTLALILPLVLSACSPSTTGIVAAPLLQDDGLSQATRQALIEAMQDEYKAHAFYEAVIKEHGQVRPFTNIIRAEKKHIQALKPLFAQYGVTVPADEYAGKIEVPETLREACEAGIQAEIDNAAMYDRFFESITEPDIIRVFTNLRNASQHNHLPAFQRCALRYQ